MELPNLRRFVTVILSLMVLFTCFTKSDDVSQSSCFCLKQVVDKLYSPVEYIPLARDDTVRTLVVEQRGIVRSYEDGKEGGQNFMDISDRVMTSNALGEERGLLSVVLHPQYNKSSTGRVFAYYIRNVSNEDYAYVSEFRATDDIVDVTSEQQLLRVRQAFVRGNGGQLLFGDDGFLYVFTGDGTGQDDLQGNAQSLETFLGKALRLDVDQQGFQGGDSSSASLYGIPPSNPFAGRQDNSRPEIFALGLRNPWRCTVDSQKRGGTGRIFCGDTGTDKFEELNIIEKGQNYGWNLKEGNYCFHSEKCNQIGENEALPIYQYPHASDSGSAVVAGYVYRGDMFPAMRGSLLYGDVVTGKTYILTESANGSWTSQEWSVCPDSLCPCQARNQGYPFLLAFGQQLNGEPVLLMTGDFTALSPKGSIFQIVAPAGTSTHSVTCGASSISTASLVTALVFLHFVRGFFV